MAGDRGDGAHIQKAVYQSSDDHDPLASVRQVAFGSPEPCQDIKGMLLSAQRTNLMGRMDQFAGGTLESQGMDKPLLDSMLQSPRFGAQDKQFIGFLRNNFDSVAGKDGNAIKMSLPEMKDLLISKGKSVCPPPEKGTPPQTQGDRYVPPPGGRLKR